MVRGVAVSADGRRVVSGSNDHTVKVCELDTGALITTFFELEEVNAPTAVASTAVLVEHYQR
jgi:WD40 repeat protein